jgi:hypothetical protein
MSAQHTPGPWVATGNGIHAGTRCVATTHFEPWEQRATDARLIAAAPELLAVAELLALAANEHDDLASGTHYVDKAGRIRCKGSFLESIGRARAAIAKATGSAS